MAELIYGIRNSDNEVVNINEIPKELRGLKCDCICPNCGQTLVARKGEIREQHFAHYFDKTIAHKSGMFYCDVEKANESALHLMAKQIIAQELAIRVPERLISPVEANVADLIQEIDAQIPSYVYQTSKLIKAQSVDLEVHLNGFTPDVLIKTERGELLVEICVRHMVTEEKARKAKDYNAAMLEIDLGGYVDASLTRDELRDIIVNKTNLKHWIHYPLSDSAIKAAQKYYENLEAVKSYRRSIAKKEAREKKVKLLFESSNYANTLKSLRSDAEFLKKCAEMHQPYYFDVCSYFKKHKTVPFFIDIPITGEMVFQCDRRIWQSILFNRFIYGRKDDYARFNKEKLFELLKDDYKIPVDYDLTYKLPNPLQNDKNIWLRKQVIERYLNHLDTIGFIFLDDNDWITVKVRKSIEPPNKIASDYLLEALDSVDLYSPDIDSLIAAKMKASFEELYRQKRLKQMEGEAERQAISEVHESKTPPVIPTSYRQAEDSTESPPKQADGCLEVKESDFSFKERIIYGYGPHRFLCDYCQKVKNKQDMMITYQNNRGICCDCYYKE